MAKLMSRTPDKRTFRLVHEQELTERDELKARLELCETPERRETGMRALKALLANIQNLNSCMDDDYLLSFLRVRKFDCDHAVTLIREHYSIRAQYPALFPSPSKLEPLLRNGFVNQLPYRDEEGRAIFVIKMSAWNTDVYSFWDVVASIILVTESTLNNPVSQVNGLIVIWDVGGYNMKHFFEMCSPKRLALISALIQDFYPVRVKKVLGVNSPTLAKTVWKLIKSLVREKLKNRVQLFGSDMSDLHQFLDPAILPQEYGGKLPSCDSDKTAQLVLDREEYFKYIRQFGYVSN
ncbi:alpha-tocopherol transfer protein-like [Uloborus diversus]|uniref:alpha-tocopherol transfer protein-like n=1 Tax=Uloborus diversus TaxID=327109 RepID=UPI002409C3F3|nr:alpha-tocopherol transfer protein-like [Uloborus diversus]XP_054715228.1 alpha-tocopherol transfer protein-like [Uloborus diversus]